MGLNSFARILYIPEDALVLRQGKLRLWKKLGSYTLKDDDVLKAAKVLISINDAQNLCSKADVIERAISHGWMPAHGLAESTLETEVQSTLETEYHAKVMNSPDYRISDNMASEMLATAARLHIEANKGYSLTEL